MRSRVLRPAGQLLFLEHVRDEDPRIAKKQDDPPFLYSWMGCHPNRATLDAITRSKLSVVAVRRGAVPNAPVIEPPMVLARATRGAPVDAPSRNTHAMTFTPLASWCRPVDGNHSQEIVSATT